MGHLFHDATKDQWRLNQKTLISISQCKKDLTPLLKHLSYVFLSLTHRLLLHVIIIYVHVDTVDKESMTPWCRRSTLFQLCLHYMYIGVLLTRMHYFAMQQTSSYHHNGHGPLTRYVKLWVARAPGMPVTFYPPPRISDPDMHRHTCVTYVPWCMLGSLTGFPWSRWSTSRQEQVMSCL